MGRELTRQGCGLAPGLPTLQPHRLQARQRRTGEAEADAAGDGLRGVAAQEESVGVAHHAQVQQLRVGRTQAERQAGR